MKLRSASRFCGGICRESGFTLIELLVVIALIGILVTLYAPELSTVRERVEKVICMSHLRSLHVSLGAYLNDNEQWPQFPKDSNGDDVDFTPQQEDQFWLDTLKEYGAVGNVWKCPTMSRQLSYQSSAQDWEGSRLDYDPATFDDNPTTPRRWPGQPWVMEKADMHHCGGLMIRADGTVQSIQDALKAAGN